MEKTTFNRTDYGGGISGNTAKTDRRKKAANDRKRKNMGYKLKSNHSV